MFLLTPAEMRRLTQIVVWHHAAYILEQFGLEASGLGKDEVDDLVSRGILDANAAREILRHGVLEDPIGNGYLAGMILQRIRDLSEQHTDKGEALTMGRVEEEMRRDAVPLGPIERRAMQAARNRAGEYCRGLGNRVDASLRTIAIEADAEQAAAVRQQIRDATAEAIAKRKTVGRLRSDIGDATSDWSRDLDRIARTELQNAHCQGIADKMAEDGDPDCYKLSSKACSACQSLLTGEDGNPLVMPLSQWRANGTNVGRKSKEWLPTIEAIHPNCACPFLEKPAGTVFAEDGQLVLETEQD